MKDSVKVPFTLKLMPSVPVLNTATQLNRKTCKKK